MKEIFISESMTQLHPAKENAGATGIPEEVKLEIFDMKNKLIGNLDNLQCNVSYWLTDNVEWHREHTQSDNQKVIWVANGNLQEKPTVTISYLKWKFNSILSWKSLVITQSEISGLESWKTSQVSKSQIANIIKSDDFVEDFMNVSMWSTQEVNVKDFWCFKIITFLWNNSFIFFEFQWNYYKFDI